METPLTIQKPENHEPTISELVSGIHKEIESKDAMIENQRQQLIEIRDLLKGVLNGSTATRANDVDATIEGQTVIGAAPTDGQIKC